MACVLFALDGIGQKIASNHIEVVCVPMVRFGVGTIWRASRGASAHSRLSSVMADDRAQKALVKRLNLCLKRPENLVCADCPMRLPRWASVNLGIFICTNCSGIHRSLGVHISFVRSTQLDRWSDEQVVKLERMGNNRANAYWEANLPKSAKPMSSDLPVVDKFIRKKYERKEFVDRNAAGPVPGDGNGDGAAAAPRQHAPAQFAVPAVAPAPAAAPQNGGLFDMLDVSAPVAAPAAPVDDGFGAFASAAVTPAPTNGNFADFGTSVPTQAAVPASTNWNFAAFGAEQAAPAPAPAPAVDEGWGAFSDAPAAPAAQPEISKNDILSMFDTPPSGMGGGMMGGVGMMPQQGMSMGGQVPQQQNFGVQLGMGMPGMQGGMQGGQHMNDFQQRPGMNPQQVQQQMMMQQQGVQGGMQGMPGMMGGGMQGMQGMRGMMPTQQFGMQMGNGGMQMGGNPRMMPQMEGGGLDDGLFSGGGAAVQKEPEKPKTQHHPAFDQFGM